MCLGVLVYLLLLGQVNIRQFENKLIVRSQKNLLQLAQARQRHCSDMLRMMSQQLVYAADRISSSSKFQEGTDSQQYPVPPLWDPMVLSFQRIDTHGAVVHSFRGDPEAVSSGAMLSAYWRGCPALDKVSLLMDRSSGQRCLSMLYPLAEGTTVQGMLVFRISMDRLLERLNDELSVQGIQTCLVDGEGRIFTGKDDADPSSPTCIGNTSNHARLMLDDMCNRRGGIGTFFQEGPSSRGFLAGYWPIDGFETPWMIAVIQEDNTIRSAVAEHARGIQLGMVCLFLTVSLIWLLFYRSVRRGILFEQQTAVARVTEELHHLAEQSRLARQQLEHQVALYRGLLNAVPMGLYWKDCEGRLAGYNPEYAHIAGLKRMEDGLSAARTELFEQQQQGLPLDMEVMNKDIELLFLPQRYGQNSLSRNYLVSKIAVKDEQGKVCGLLGGMLNQDLLRTGRKNAFCTYFRNDCATETLPAPAMIVDRQGRILHANAAFLRRFELDTQLGVQWELSTLFAAESVETIFRNICDCSETQPAETKGFHVRWRCDCFRTTAQPFYERGELKGVLLLLTDVSAVKQSESYLESILHRYRRAVKKLSAQLNSLEERAQKLSAKPFEDAARTADELKFRIGSCLEQLTYCDALSMETAEPMETENSLINAGQLAEAVRQHISQKYDPAPPRMEIALGRQCSAVFESDRHKLYQTLLILAEQAAEYAMEGTFSLRIDSTESADRQNTIVFLIEHPGVLALGDELKKIIDPDVSLLEWYPACVLRDQAVNLRVAARLLAKIGGRLRIDSHSGQTRYYAELPVCAAAGASELPSQKTETKKESTLMQDQNKPIERPTERRSARILVVDDVEENRALLEVILSKLGYAPVQCSGGKQAVLLCRQEKYDIILMDIQMPEVDGFEAVKQIRADSLNAASPIIAMTASNQKDDELTALDCGCDDYLIKPINRKLLEQKIWRNLAKMRQIQEAEQGQEITSFLEGDPDYHKTIETFVGNLPGRIEDIRQAFEKHDIKDLAFKVHALKGLGGFAGFAVYTDKAAKIEESLREKDVDKIQFQIDEMVQLCMRTKIKSDIK